MIKLLKNMNKNWHKKSKKLEKNAKKLEKKEKERYNIRWDIIEIKIPRFKEEVE